MKKLVRFLSIALVFALLLAAFAGCKKSDGGTKVEVGPDGEPLKEITLEWIGAGWDLNEKAATIIAAWEAEHPKVKVKYTNLSTLVDTNYLKNLDTTIAGNTVVDLTYLGIDDIYTRVMAGGALPLSEYIEADKDNKFVELFGEGAMAALTYEGKIYGVPYATNTFKVFYNKDICDAAGVTIPETWTIDEFRETAKKLNKPEENFWGCVLPSTWMDTVLTSAWLCGWDFVVADGDNAKPKPNFDDPTFRQVCQWAYDLAETDKVTPSYATIKAESLHRRMALFEGDTAMIIDGPYTLIWGQNYMFNDPGTGKIKFNLGVTEVPYANEKGANLSYNTLVGGFYIPKTAKYPEWAYKFITFLCTEMGTFQNYAPAYLGANFTEAASAFQNYVDKAGNKHTDIYPQETAEGAIRAKFPSQQGKYPRNPVWAPYYVLMQKLMNQEWPRFLNGELSLDEFVNLLNEQGAREIADN